MKDIIPLSVPFIRGNEKKYVMECLDSEWVSSSGSFVTRFEQDLASYVGCRGAVACVNGTAALHVSLLIAGVQPGDEVIVPTLTFIAPVNAVKYVFAEPVFMDCDEYLNLDLAKLADFLEEECSFDGERTFDKKTGRRVAAIIPVHVFGSICEMDAIMELAGRYKLAVIEDATESLGSKMTAGRFKGRHAGSIGDFGAYSFNGNKIITCGGGGMLVASSDDDLKKAKYLTTQAKDDELRYVHNEIGYNYRLTALQAAMGLAQLEQMPLFLKIKRERYLEYKNFISDIPGLSMVEIPPYCESNCWFYSLRVDKELYGMDRDALMNVFEGEGIQSRPIWNLNHSQKPYRDSRNYRIESAVLAQNQILNLPCSVGLDDGQFDRIIGLLVACKSLKT